ncbi:transposase [Streptomyces sp. NPDC006678]|uniref:transposase n=1 Tax=Streptomyces sp. NPDC006678 TaxID=3157185 RepID=UPI00340E0389
MSLPRHDHPRAGAQGPAPSCWTTHPPTSAAWSRAPGPFCRTTVSLFYLPPYSPELNRIKRMWRSVKYEDIPIRAYPWNRGTPGHRRAGPHPARHSTPNHGTRLMQDRLGVFQPLP